MIDKDWKILYPDKISTETLSSEIVDILLKNRKINRNKRESFTSPPKPTGIDPVAVGIKKNQIKKAVDLIKKVGKEKKIVIYGDYDVDGLTATAIIWEALWKRGYDVVPFIPHREEDGYGLKKRVVKRLIKEYSNLGLIITVDNGIVAFEAVDYVKSQGLDIIITDHHLAQDKLPKADAIVHSTLISGAAVSWFLASNFGYHSLDLVALGTIADLLPLTDFNRSFVKYGLKELGSTKRIGLKVLKEKAGIGKEELLPWQISFILAPRLNAAGRLEEALEALRLLCTKSFTKASVIANKLENINRQRQKLTLEGLEHARKKTRSSKDKIIFAVDRSYHPGIIGLIAGKLVEEFYRPTIVISKDKETSKASARSVNGCNIIELIRRGQKLLVDCGGHPMAAGFTIETKNIKAYIEKITKIANREIKKGDLVPELKIDFEIGFDLINKGFCALIQDLAPFGFGNPEPVLVIKGARVIDFRTMGTNGQHLRLKLDDPETTKVEQVVAEAVGFGWGSWGANLQIGDLVDVAFNIDINRWRGEERVQLKIKDMRKVS